MKKKIAVVLSLCVCTILFVGCNTNSNNNADQIVKAYSFNGENEYISISNGVIISNGEEDVCYGGDLKLKSKEFNHIASYSTTFYINGSEKEKLLSNSVNDKTGESAEISKKIGQISGDILKESDAEKIGNNLWFELKTTDLKGKNKTYKIQLDVTEITKEEL